MLESDFSELKTEITKVRGELIQTKIRLDEALKAQPQLAESKRSSTTPTPVPQSLNATATSIAMEASNAHLQDVAERLKRIADKCRQRPKLASSIRITSSTQ